LTIAIDAVEPAVRATPVAEATVRFSWPALEAGTELASRQTTRRNLLRVSTDLVLERNKLGAQQPGDRRATDLGALVAGIRGPLTPS
jgi:hypothetical protein